MKTLADMIKENSFFEGLSEEQIEFIAGCGKNVVFKEAQTIANPGDQANEFYLIKEGHVGLTIETSPRKPFLFQTLGPKDIVGLSWLIPPYLWTISAQAIELTTAIAFNGACIREKCESDPRLGFNLMKHLIKILVIREDACRLHLLDVYGEHE